MTSMRNISECITTCNFFIEICEKGDKGRKKSQISRRVRDLRAGREHRYRYFRRGSVFLYVQKPSERIQATASDGSHDRGTVGWRAR